MIDGIQIDTEIQDFKSWKAKMPFTVMTPIDTSTGEIISISRMDKKTGVTYQTVKHTARFETYTLLIREVYYPGVPIRYYLKINGSLHKNRFNGNNYNRFYFSDVCNEINKLCDVLKINSNQAKISNLEFGVNINVNFVPHIFLRDNLINCKNVPFEQYSPDSNNKRIGYKSELTQYLVKCYDKGYQNDLRYNLLRYELSFQKMQKLNRDFNIENLVDLTVPANVDCLIKLLLTAWKNTLLSEPLDTRDFRLTRLQQNLITCGTNPRYWESLKSDRRRLQYHKNVYKQLILKCGTGIHGDIYKKIANEWELLFNQNC